MINHANRQKKALKQRFKLSRLLNEDTVVLKVFRSLKHIYAQVVKGGRVIASSSSLQPATKSIIEEQLSSTDKGRNHIASETVGRDIASICKKHNIERVIFDRSGFIFTGRIKTLADSARKHGLQF